MASSERLCDVARQNGVKRIEIDHRALDAIDDGTNRHLKAVQVAMRLARAALRKLVRRVQRNGPGQGTVRAAGHKTIPIPSRNSGVTVYCPVRPVGLTALDCVGVPGCFAGSWAYDAG